ncbi:MAG: T9SS type A sorting domain-containing protein, partial [Candidatus Cloacimonetes bacterium]|nr:T9SS type A sorting domain-containing protein [Candidatus Cloacimonadota bacterium]
ADLPSQNSDNWQNSGDIDLNDFTNDEVNIAFQYTSTGFGANNTTAWAIDDLNVMGYEPSSVENNYNISNYGLSNFPNPITVGTSSTQISFSLTESSQNAQIEIFNIKGQKVKQLRRNSVNQLTAGQHSVVWDGTDYNNRKVRTGIYFINLKIDNINVDNKRCLVIH